MISSDPTPLLTVADLQSHSLTGVVQRELERMILNGEFLPGERLNEQAIADKLAVSRGPVREACRALAEMGLVHLIANRGVFIKQLTKADAIEVYDVRAGMTALAASFLAPRLTAQSLKDLQNFVDEMELAAESGDFKKFYPINLEFHDYIVKTTENSRLMKLYRGLVKEFHLFRTHGLVQRAALLESNKEHREIVAALQQHDSELSYETSFRHVRNGKQRMLVALDGLDDSAPVYGGSGATGSNR